MSHTLDPHCATVSANASEEEEGSAEARPDSWCEEGSPQGSSPEESEGEEDPRSSS